MGMTVHNHSGRVVEIFSRERDTDEAQMAQFREDLKGAVAAATRGGRRMVVVADLRAITVVGPTMANFYIEVMRKDNKDLERSAVLTSSAANATFVMQMERVMRESANPNRRRFETDTALTAWLAEILDDAEMTRIREFLAENAPK